MTEPTERSIHRAHRSLPAAYLPAGHSSTHVAASLKVFSVLPRTRLGGVDSWNVFTGLYGRRNLNLLHASAICLFPKQMPKVGLYMHYKPLTKWDENPSRTGWNHVKPVSLWPDWSLKHREIREWTIQNVVVESTKIGLLTLGFMGFILVFAAVYAHRFRWESNACVSVLLPSLRGSAHYGWMEKQTSPLNNSHQSQQKISEDSTVKAIY